MIPAPTELLVDLEKLEYSRRHAGVKYISSVYGKPMEASENLVASYWFQGLHKPAQFIGSANSAVTVGGRLFLELSPQPILTGLMKKNCPEANFICIPSLRKNISNWRTIIEAVAALYLHRIEVDWAKIWNNLNDNTNKRVCIKPVPHLLPKYSLPN